MSRFVCLGEGMIEERVGPNGSSVERFGGDTLNTAVHLARLGNRVSFASAVGSDLESDKMIAAWQAEGLDCSLLRRHPRRTLGRYRIETDAAGERRFYYDRVDSAAREMFELPDSTWHNVFSGVDLFYFSLISLAILDDSSRNRLLDFARNAARHGVMVAFDNNYRPPLWESAEAARSWRDKAIGVADIGLPTASDELLLGFADDPSSISGRWSELGCREVVVKVGESGCFVAGDGALPLGKRLKPIDTSGAGDAFNAGYLSARLYGRSQQEAANMGHALAGWTIMRHGAIPPIDDEYPARTPSY